MQRSVRVLLSIVAGCVVSVLVVFLSVVVDNLEGFALGHAIHNLFISPGVAFSALFGYSACPLLRQWFGWSGPGGAYMQMLLISFLAWAMVFSFAAYLILGRWKQKQP